MAPSLLIVVLMMVVLYQCDAVDRIFYVGDNDGWTIKRSGSYNQWADRYAFLTNDELVFMYNKGIDSVLLVNEKDYYKCNKDNPIEKLKIEYDRSRFTLNRTGPFYFISGHNQNCENGQKFVIVVPPQVQAPPPSYARLVKPPSPVTAKTTARVSLLESPSQSPSPSFETTDDKAFVELPFQTTSPSPSPNVQNTGRDSDNSPAESPTVGTTAEPQSDRPPFESPSPSPNVQNTGRDFDNSPAESPTGTTPKPQFDQPPSKSPLQSPTVQNTRRDFDNSPAESPTVGTTSKPQFDQPPSKSPLQSPNVQNTGRDFDNSPAESPAVGTTQKPQSYQPLFESPSPSPSPNVQNTRRDSDNSPAESPAVGTTPKPQTDQPPSESPLPSPRRNSAVYDHIALPPQAHSSPGFAPAPAPSAASTFSFSFVLVVGLSVVATMISTGPF